MRILVLDDSLERHKVFRKNLIGHEKVIHVHTYDEACKALRDHEFDLMFLDHDLNFEQFESVRKDEDGITWELTGADVAKEVSTLPEVRRPRHVVVHSYNPSGAMNMIKILESAQIRATYDPFSSRIGLDHR